MAREELAAVVLPSEARQSARRCDDLAISKAGCLLSCCIGKTPFSGFLFVS